MGERWRLFVAVPIPDELRAALVEAVERWRDRPDLAGLRWTDPAAWHLTVLFIGATDPAAVPGIVKALGEVASGHAPMRLATGGLGGFPAASRARVAWYGLHDADDALGHLARDVRRGIADQQSPFRAHVTLARAREQPVDLRDWIVNGGEPSGEMAVTRISLMRSHLGQGPARYETIAALPMGATVHA